MTSFGFSQRIEVRFRDCDPMGHVNHAVYLTYLEHARFAYGRDLLDGTDIILARIECDYRSQATFGDVIEVRIRIGTIGRSSFALEYEIVAEGGRLVASARSVQVTYDYREQKSIPIPGEVRRRLEEERARI